MGIGALLGGVVGGLFQASASKKAANAQVDAANAQAGVQREMYYDTKGMLKPYRQAGRKALNALNFEMGLGAAPEGYQGFQATPGYQWQLDQGQKAIDRSAAASGGLFSGNTGKALAQYGQGLASQEYGNYYNRLAGLAGGGQNAAAQTGSFGAGAANGISNAYANRGNAQAAGYIGSANAINSGIGNALGIWQYQNQIGQPISFNAGNLFGGNSWG